MNVTSHALIVQVSSAAQDLKTYDNECKMREAACNAKKDISVLVRDKCG